MVIDHPWGRAAKIQPTIRPTEYRCYIKEDAPNMAQRVRIPHRGQKSFVCHPTPHFDSTSREVSYSVRSHHTRKRAKCK